MARQHIRRTYLTVIGLGIVLGLFVVAVIQYAPLSQTPPRHQEGAADLTAASKNDIAQQLVSAAENSTLNWRAQYGYIEYNVEGNEPENRGYTGGIIGFTTRTGDMLDLATYYSRISPGNILEKYLPALASVNGSSSTTGLGAAFESDWRAAAEMTDGKFKAAQDHERNRVYFIPAVTLAKTDNLQALGQFIYYDASVTHGPEGLTDIRDRTRQLALTPAEGGDETAYLNTFLDVRIKEMRSEAGHQDTTRIDTMQRKLLNEKNLTLRTPFTVSVYDDTYTVR
jgi:chitosanase